MLEKKQRRDVCVFLGEGEGERSRAHCSATGTTGYKTIILRNSQNDKPGGEYAHLEEIAARVSLGNAFEKETAGGVVLKSDMVFRQPRYKQI